MDVDQLRMTLEAVAELSEEARSFGVWYLVTQAIPSMLSSTLLFVFGVIGLMLLYKSIRRICESSEACSFGWEVAAKLGLSCRDVSWSGSVAKEILNKIEHLQSESKG